MSAARGARRLRAWLTLALAALLAGIWLYFHLAPPATAFRAFNTDPELAYFLDSLAPFKGLRYRGIHHPGLPLTMLGTGLLALLYPFSPGAGGRFAAHMVRHPEPFFVLAHALLSAANIACVVALSRLALPVRRRRDALLAVAVPASFFAFLPQAFFWPFYWSHNAVAFPAGAAILLGLLVTLRRGRPLASKTLALLGLAAGLLAATQVYFATWAIGVGVAATLVERIAGRRRWSPRPALVTLAAAALGFLLGTLPMLGEYRPFLAWARSLALHQGIYGAGSRGFTTPALWLTNVSTLMRSAPLLFAATGCTLALLLALLVARPPRVRRETGLWAAAGGVSLQWLATLALFGKHPSRFYLPALAAMLCLLLALAFALARGRGRAGRWACLALAAASLVGCCRAAVLAVGDHSARLAFRSAMDREVHEARAVFAAERGLPGGRAVLLLWGPGLPDAACYALWGVNLYLAEGFRSEVSAVCPSDGLAWSWSVAVPEGWRGLEGVAALLVTTEDARIRFPALGALGEPALGAERDPNGQRIAFYRVTVRDGRAHREGR